MFDPIKNDLKKQIKEIKKYLDKIQKQVNVKNPKKNKK